MQPTRLQILSCICASANTDGRADESPPSENLDCLCSPPTCIQFPRTHFFQAKCFSSVYVHLCKNTYFSWRWHDLELSITIEHSSLTSLQLQSASLLVHCSSCAPSIYITKVTLFPIVTAACAFPVWYSCSSFKSHFPSGFILDPHLMYFLLDLHFYTWILSTRKPL